MRREIYKKLINADLQLPDLAKGINRSLDYTSRALNGRGRFRVDEAFKVAEMLNLSADDVKRLFAS